MRFFCFSSKVSYACSELVLPENIGRICFLSSCRKNAPCRCDGQSPLAYFTYRMSLQVWVPSGLIWPGIQHLNPRPTCCSTETLTDISLGWQLNVQPGKFPPRKGKRWWEFNWQIWGNRLQQATRIGFKQCSNSRWELVCPAKFVFNQNQKSPVAPRPFVSEHADSTPQHGPERTFR